jgi:hypothetical protein
MAHIILFSLSGIMLGMGATNMGNKPAYKMMLALGILMAAFSLALVFTLTLGSQQTLNALIDKESNEKQLLINDTNFFLRRSKTMSTVQDIHLAVVTFFYISIGFLYAGANSPKFIGFV